LKIFLIRNKLIEDITEYIKDKRIDILVNSAGVLDKEPWLAKTPEGFDKVMNTNLKAIYFLCQTIANHMINKNIKGHILNISSSSSMRPSWGPYQLSKRALNGLTLGFAQRLAPNGIVVNGIAPGVTATPMMDGVLEEGNLSYPNPLRRASAPEEIANLAVFLASDLGNSVVGDTVMMTGGSGNLSFDY
jgi:NAD(P)-dependent dehydrogenase (short-subunit alcohol dehydrogenase family)